MTKQHPIGIDLGTTYSAVSRLDETGRTVMVRNREGELLTPSVVLFDDNEVVVGKEAKKAVGVAQGRVAECVKREMGASRFSQKIRGQYLPPEVIQACILRKLKDDATDVLGPNIQAVITVPAYFDEPRRKATADAGEMASLNVLDIVNEPTAAALAFGEQLGYLDPAGSPKECIKVLVYDLGGGTFDVTVIELQPGVFRTLATDGDVALGGRDWDMRLAHHVADEFYKQHGIDPRKDPAAMQRLLRVVEDVKHTLSARDQASIHLELSGKSADMNVTRPEFAELTEDLLERTAYTSRQVMLAAGVAWSEISHVLLVGGSTRMPMVSDMLQKLSNRRPEHGVNADEAVARGAAIYAGYLVASRDKRGPTPKFKVTDVNSHSLGVAGVDPQTLRKENFIVIGRNTPLPARVTSKFVTRSERQSSVVIEVLEGESKVPDQCTQIARAVMRDLPSGLPKGWPIEVTYEYKTNGRLSISANMPGTTRELKIDLEREHGLSDDRRTKWQGVVSGEKGFDAFSSMLEEALGLEDAEPRKTETKASAKPVVKADPRAFETLDDPLELLPLDLAPNRPADGLPGRGAAQAKPMAPSYPTAAANLATAKPMASGALARPAAPMGTPVASTASGARQAPAQGQSYAGGQVKGAAGDLRKASTSGPNHFQDDAEEIELEQPRPAEPQAASPVFNTGRPSTARRGHGPLYYLVNVLGFVTVNLLGLWLGLKILEAIAPNSQVLKMLPEFLHTPAAPAPVAPAPVVPGAPPAMP